MGRRTLEDIDRDIQKLKTERKTMIQRVKSDVGEILLNVIPSIPQGKKECRGFIEDMAELVRRHSDEFAALRRGRVLGNNKKQNTAESVSQPNRGDVNYEQGSETQG